MFARFAAELHRSFAPFQSSGDEKSAPLFRAPGIAHTQPPAPRQLFILALSVSSAPCLVSRLCVSAPAHGERLPPAGRTAVSSDIQAELAVALLFVLPIKQRTLQQLR
jgi:hypothetical protein